MARRARIVDIEGRMSSGMGIDDTVFTVWGHSHLVGTGLRDAHDHRHPQLLTISLEGCNEHWC